jgi:hypothetical protein
MKKNRALKKQIKKAQEKFNGLTENARNMVMLLREDGIHNATDLRKADFIPKLYDSLSGECDFGFMSINGKSFLNTEDLMSLLKYYNLPVKTYNDPVFLTFHNEPNGKSDSIANETGSVRHLSRISDKQKGRAKAITVYHGKKVASKPTLKYAFAEAGGHYDRFVELCKEYKAVSIKPLKDVFNFYQSFFGMREAA